MAVDLLPYPPEKYWTEMENKPLLEVYDMASNGDSYAMVDLSTRYSLGRRGVKQNLDKATSYYVRAGKLGNPDALYRVAIDFRDGDEKRGIPQNDSNAIELLEILSFAGDKNAPDVLALRFYLEKEKACYNPVEGLAWLYIAAERDRLLLGSDSLAFWEKKYSKKTKGKAIKRLEEIQNIIKTGSFPKKVPDSVLNIQLTIDS